MNGRVIHPFEPVIGERSRLLILGTMASVKSREYGFYYMHPQNRFWPVIATIFGVPVPETNEGKTKLLLENDIALWDVLASCDITGSGDASIKNAVCNDIGALIKGKQIERILCNGGKAYTLYMQNFNFPLPVVKMPSTSPANASWSIERLTSAWRAELLGWERI